MRDTSFKCQLHVYRLFSWRVHIGEVFYTNILILLYTKNMLANDFLKDRGEYSGNLKILIYLIQT